MIAKKLEVIECLEKIIREKDQTIRDTHNKWCDSQRELDATQKDLKIEKGHMSKALDCAEEGTLAAGIASRTVMRLMDQNDMLTHDMTRIANERRR